jgi:transposase
MLIVGCDYHPSVQQIAFADTETGDYGEQRLKHSDGEAEKFYRDLKLRGMNVRVGLEATGHTRWFERLLSDWGWEFWIGDVAQIAAMRVRKQKTDRQDAQFLLKLMIEDRFPRVWVPSPENRDLRQLLWHRHRLVQMRTRILNQLQSVAMNEGIQRRGGLRSEQGRKRLEQISLAPWAAQRRQDLLVLLDQLNEKVDKLTAAVQQEAEKRPETQLLMTHPGVGPVTALAFVLIIGYPERFQCGKQIGSYIGLIPQEASSGEHRRLGHISKQGSCLLRFLLVEAAQAAARFNPEWRGKFSSPGDAPRSPDREGSDCA